MNFRYLAVFAFATVASASFAQITFSGTDFGVGPGNPRPNSDGAAAAFTTVAASLNSISVITFENQAVGDPSTFPRNLLPGVTATMSNVWFGGGIRFTEDAILGYNTTPGGEKYMKYGAAANPGPSITTINFAAPIQSFGGYFTGLGTASGTTRIEYNNRSFTLNGSPNGGVQFFGVVDPSQLIYSVRLIVDTPTGAPANDEVGIDDIRFNYCTSVPEPATMTALGLGLAAIASRRRRK